MDHSSFRKLRSKVTCCEPFGVGWFQRVAPLVKWLYYRKRRITCRFWTEPSETASISCRDHSERKAVLVKALLIARSRQSIKLNPTGLKCNSSNTIDSKDEWLAPLDHKGGGLEASLNRTSTESSHRSLVRNGLSNASSVFTICFLVEVIMKLIAFTPYGFWQSQRNRADLFVTIMGVVWIVLNYVIGNQVKSLILLNACLIWSWWLSLC